MMKKAIDVSRFQGDIDWKNVPSSIETVIVKLSQGRSETNFNATFFVDSKAEKNITEAYTVGKEVGVYHYLTAQNLVEAKDEATLFLNALSKYKSILNSWICVDVESKYLSTDKEVLTKCVNEFCRNIAEAGYRICVYTNPNFLKNRLGTIEYPIWLAHWVSDNPLWMAPDKAHLDTFTRGYDNVIAWQWGTYASLKGIDGKVDGNTVIANPPKFTVGNKVKYAKCKLYEIHKLLSYYVKTVELVGDTWEYEISRTKNGKAADTLKESELK